jgi:rhamnosyltransferase
MDDKIAVVVVTYQPNLDALDLLVRSVVDQVHSILIIDNGSDVGDFSGRYDDSRVRFVAMGRNTGIAVAQNVGITLAQEMNATHVVLFDQDSVAAADMVARLLGAAAAAQNVACVGPRFLDERRKNPSPFIQVRGFWLHRPRCERSDDVVPVTHVIASGCLIPMPVLRAVGGMREDLFIDYVDIEWGLRARRHGYVSYGACAAHMRHSLGDNPISFFGATYPLHSPLRHYYHFRNAILVYKEPWIPTRWKVADGWRLCLKYVFYSLFAKPRLRHWRMMTLGVWHGIVGKTGQLDAVG